MYHLHQTWKTHDIPTDLLEMKNTWFQHNISWNYHFYTDEDLRKLILCYVPQYITLYDDFKRPLERVDFARYVMMMVFGGVYADLDTILLKSVVPLIEQNKLLLGLEPYEHAKYLYSGRRTVICNAVIISPVSHPFWSGLLHFISKTYDPGKATEWNTGPMAITRYYEMHPEHFSDVTLLPPVFWFPMTDYLPGSETQYHKKLGKYFHAISTCCDVNYSYVIHMWKHTALPNNISKLTAIFRPMLNYRNFLFAVTFVLLSTIVLYSTERTYSKIVTVIILFGMIYFGLDMSTPIL